MLKRRSINYVCGTKTLTLITCEPTKIETSNFANLIYQWKPYGSVALPFVLKYDNLDFVATGGGGDLVFHKHILLFNIQ